jgi:4-hydroxy-4-methyl-2-oxoglutarate aldolase
VNIDAPVAAKVVPFEIVEDFRKIDVACIGDALRGLGLNCVYQGVKPLLREWTMCGPAITMRLVPLQDRQKWYEWERHPRQLVNLAKPGDVLVIDQGGDLDYTLWGGNVAGGGRRAKLGGVVIDGATRDAMSCIAAGIPTFVKGTTPQHGHGVYGTTCFNNEPVRIGSISIAPGDLVVGNADGIAVIPWSRATEVLALAQERHHLDTTAPEATPENAKTRMLTRSRIYGLEPPPEYR